jgi:predicted acetyltransferase
MLAAALPVACSLGITDALLTCLDTNIGSRRVIEANAGRFIGMSGPKRRYLVPTGEFRQPKGRR